MNLEKAKRFGVLLFLLGFIPTSLYLMVFDDNIAVAKYQGFRSFSKKNWGGIVYNNTNQSLKVTDYIQSFTLPPNKNSRDIGIFDVDSLIIDKPMYFENEKYFNNVLKFCDYSRINVFLNNGKIIVKPKNKWICKLLDDFDIYNSLNEAFSR